MLPQYKTIKQTSSEQQVIQKSRFIGYVKRVEIEDEAISFIQTIKQKHTDATHNCSAYLIGEHDDIQKANDDGEPSGTAGMPMLEVLKKKGLKDTVIVVTRYFGGIKLGAGGLIRAYGSTTTLAIETAGTVMRTLNQGYTVTVDYTLLGKLENDVRHSEFYLSTIQYGAKPELHLYVETTKQDQFTDWMTDLTNGTAIIKQTDQCYLETDLT